MMNLADIMMNVYILESTLLRVEKLDNKGLKPNISIYKDILDVLTQNLSNEIYMSGFDAIGSFAEGSEKLKLLKLFDNFVKIEPINIKEARRRIADKLIDDNFYNF